MIDLRLVRSDPNAVKAALARRGLSGDEVDRVAELDVAHRALLQSQELLRSEVKTLSKEVGAARKAGDAERASVLQEQSRTVGDEERELAAEADAAGYVAYSPAGTGSPAG